MPAKRLPWFRFWIDATAHGKVRQLDDATFRTWVELLDAAAKQPKRGRFESRKEAVSVLRRPAKHIAALIAATLIDETPEGLVMHDWDEWQRWRQEDTNDDGSTLDQLANDSGTTRNGHANVLPLRVSAEGDTETDTEAPNGAARAGVPKPNRSSQVIDAIRALGQEPNLTARDHAALKASAAKPELVAEVYCAVFRGDYGDPYMQRHLSVREAIGWIDGYRSWKTSGVPRPGRNGTSEPRQTIDRTGVEN